MNDDAMMDDYPEEMVQALVQELRNAPVMEITWRPDSVLVIAGLVQLAIRHPAISAHSRTLAERFLGFVREHFADYPTVIDALRRGDGAPPAETNE